MPRCRTPAPRRQAPRDEQTRRDPQLCSWSLGRVLVVEVDVADVDRTTRRRRRRDADDHDGRRRGPRSIGHVFVINLENEDYDDDVGRELARALPQRHAGAEGQAAHAVLRDRPREPRQLHRRDQRSVARTRRRRATASTTSEFAATGTGTYGQALGKGCVYPKSVKTIADQLTAAGKTWRAYQEDMGTPCRHPAHRRERHDDRRRSRTTCTRPATTRSSTSTRSSTRPRARRTSSTSIALATDLKSVATTPNLVFITPNVCHDGHDAPCVDGEPGGLVSADRFLGDRGAEDPGVARVQGRRHARDHGRRGRRSRAPTACCHTPPSPNAAKPGLGGPGRRADRDAACSRRA